LIQKEVRQRIRSTDVTDVTDGRKREEGRGKREEGRGKRETRKRGNEAEPLDIYSQAERAWEQGGRG